MRSVAQVRLQHTIVVAYVIGTDAAVACCLRCGGYAARFARALGVGCVPRAAADQPFRKVFERARHPNNGSRLTEWMLVANWE